MKLQISSQLAIFAVLKLMAHPERQLTVGEIGRQFGVSNHHLAKVMNVLGRAGLVRSVRGVGGGYQFSGNARRTTLLDVIELFEKLGTANTDDAEKEATISEARALGDVLREIDDIARSTFGSITLATLHRMAARHRGGQPAAEAGEPGVGLDAVPLAVVAGAQRRR